MRYRYKVGGIIALWSLCNAANACAVSVIPEPVILTYIFWVILFGVAAGSTIYFSKRQRFGQAVFYSRYCHFWQYLTAASAISSLVVLHYARENLASMCVVTPELQFAIMSIGICCALVLLTALASPAYEYHLKRDEKSVAVLTCLSLLVTGLNFLYVASILYTLILDYL